MPARFSRSKENKYTRSSRLADRKAPKRACQRLGIEIAADQDELRLPPLAGGPGALLYAVDDIVHGLQDETLRLIRKGENPLAPEDAIAVAFDESAKPTEQPLAIDFAVMEERDRNDRIVVHMIIARVMIMMMTRVRLS
jgi:hypothetical protein